MQISNLPQDIIGKLNVLGLEKLKTHRFAVQIDNDYLKGAIVGFNKIINLRDSIEIREIKEGGYPGRYKFPRCSKQDSIMLVKGMAYSRELYNWYQTTLNWGYSKNDPDFTRTLSIFMLNEIWVKGQSIVFEVWRWNLFKAWPSEWIGPDLDSLSNEIAFESIVIEHSGITEAKGVFSGKTGDILSLFN